MEYLNKGGNMCEFISGIWHKTEGLLWDPEHTDSHETLIRSLRTSGLGLRDDRLENRTWVRIEYMPPSGGDDVIDMSTWDLRVDEFDTLPDWYDGDRCLAACRAAVSRMVVTDDRDLLLGGCWVIGGGARVKRVESARAIVSGSARINYVSGSAKIYRVHGAAEIDNVYDSARINYVYDSAKINYVYGAAKIDYVYGSAGIYRVYDSAKIGNVYGAAKIDYVYGSARIGGVFDSAEIDEAYGSARIDHVYGSAGIGGVYGSVRIGSVSGSVRIGGVHGAAEIGSVYGAAEIGSVSGVAKILTDNRR